MRNECENSGPDKYLIWIKGYEKGPVMKVKVSDLKSALAENYEDF
jgi:predicted RNA-binding protein with TRAM domain